MTNCNSWGNNDYWWIIIIFAIILIWCCCGNNSNDCGCNGANICRDDCCGGCCR